MIFLGSMFSINLLPAYEKKVIRMEEMRRAVVFFSVLTLAVFSAGILLLNHGRGDHAPARGP
ncbi:MAG: hypothetical protein Greene071436_328 [Parcubacteria group bacterium Greene0714_36]|nr:MAG: hypothetical protein Greene071436_328 [Parcubacteria group bacterium Greene0714_36]